MTFSQVLITLILILILISDDPSIWLSPLLASGYNQSVGISVPMVSRWLWPGNRIFLELASMVVTWWIVAFLCGAGTTWLDFENGITAHSSLYFDTDMNIMSYSNTSLRIIFVSLPHEFDCKIPWVAHWILLFTEFKLRKYIDAIMDCLISIGYVTNYGPPPPHSPPPPSNLTSFSTLNFYFNHFRNRTLDRTMD